MQLQRSEKPLIDRIGKAIIGLPRQLVGSWTWRALGRHRDSRQCWCWCWCWRCTAHSLAMLQMPPVLPFSLFSH